ncbi:MAG: hypothetical protein LBK66_13960 [Spirochaetaceae bacterium]|nr:hypothetical protein [Spirochaetaceae bacterium]
MIFETYSYFMKRFCFLLFALFWALDTAFTQTKDMIFAPFVSGLRADVNGRQVRLSWTDSDSVNGPVYIYRSVQPYQNTNSENASQTAEVAYGLQTYTDNLPSDGKWYYFVAASDQTSQKYELVLPFNNTIEVLADIRNENYMQFFSRSPQGVPEPYQRAYGNTSPAPPYYGPPSGIIQPPARGSITGITAASSGTGIEIRFQAADPSKNAVLYRNIKPLRSFSDLITSTVVALNIRSPYMDYATPGIPYYYAVVYEDDIKTRQGEIYPGSNATFIPAEISPNQKPAVSGNNSASAGSTGGLYAIPNQNPNAVNSQQTYQAYQTNDTQTISGEPRVFNRDMQISDDPDDHRLALIIQGPFMWRDWPAARERLTEFIIDTPNGDAAERARFYLAQCWYFIGDIRMALSTFLKLQQIYPDETAKWIQASLNKLAER